jgi:putative spermidine/putrescine transport system permease protein
MTNRTFVLICFTPLFIFSLTFLALPLIRLFLASGEGDNGWAIYLDILRKPRYLSTLLQTVLVSSAVTFAFASSLSLSAFA